MARTKVLIVDDSAVVRGLFKKMLDDELDMEVVSTVSNGLLAVDYVKANPVDVVLLDLEMPKLDGLATLPQLVSINPKIKVLMVSSFTSTGSQQTVKALTLGAVDYIHKPQSSTGSVHSLKNEIINKIRAVAGTTRPAMKVAPKVTLTSTQAFKDFKPEILVIGSSTGGPNALNEVLSRLEPTFQLPIIIVQHIPANFSEPLAERLSHASYRPCVVARSGMHIQENKVYLAPGDSHVVIKKDGEDRLLMLNKGPEENYCRPSVDPLFRSAAEIYGDHTLGLILTGMGEDGRRGAEAIVKVGGKIVAQDEESSVVWGMPGAVCKAGLAHSILSLKEIPVKLVSIAKNSWRTAC